VTDHRSSNCPPGENVKMIKDKIIKNFVWRNDQIVQLAKSVCMERLSEAHLESLARTLASRHVDNSHLPLLVSEFLSYPF